MWKIFSVPCGSALYKFHCIFLYSILQFYLLIKYRNINNYYVNHVLYLALMCPLGYRTHFCHQVIGTNPTPSGLALCPISKEKNYLHSRATTDINSKVYWVCVSCT
jgi:hypothetical protein